MKIAIYVPSWPPGFSANGIVTYAAELIPALRHLGHEVYVLTSNSTASACEGYTVDLRKFDTHYPFWYRIVSRIFPSHFSHHASAYRIFKAVTELKKHHHLDILEIEESFGWSLMTTQAELIPVVVRLHGPWFLNGRFDGRSGSGHSSRIALEGRAIRAATFVTAPSANVLENVRKHYELEINHARVIPNPIHTPANTAWQLSTCDANRILYVGRFDRRKGGDIVLQAFACLAKMFPSLRLSFVGPDLGIYEGEDSLSFDQFVRKNLPAYCWPRIDFRGELTHQGVMSARTEHIITIVASQFEILPYSVLEAMSLGCPIIASSVGGIPELITDHRNGLLFDSQNVEGLISACRKLLMDHNFASSLGAQAQKDCAAFYNTQTIATKTISAYQTAIQSYQASRGRHQKRKSALDWIVKRLNCF
jgi:glycosyltransferase involved in cell wall biosynthesis